MRPRPSSTKASVFPCAAPTLCCRHCCCLASPPFSRISPSLANYDHSARYKGSPVLPYRGYPEAVTGYPANPFGLVQMEGNVWEWTNGCLAGAAEPCKARVLRGGSFQSAPGELRLANRFSLPDDKVRSDVGLRVARDVDPDELRR